MNADSKPTREDNKTKDNAADTPAVVAIGASAGGLEALKQLFMAMPTDSGLCFVAIMHLPPDRKSMLPEILAHCTSMKVAVAEDGMVLQPNALFLLPADRELTVGEGRFRLGDPYRPDRVSHVIDRFFSSLATELGERLIAVILSGAGNDGAQGVTAVKKRGGLVFVQEPESAMYPDMPLSAIATGVADAVLPVAAMPAKIIETSLGYSGDLTVTEQTIKQEEQLLAILRLVKSNTGHDFSAYKTDTVLRRVQRRMAVHDVNSLAKYATLLGKNPQEAEALYKDILIGVTSFFRDPEAFCAIRREVIPRLFAGRDQDDTVRIWHPCCATGEEVYSLAILVQEYLNEQGLATKVQFFATDLDEGAVALARAGFFPLSIAADLDKDRLDTWFTRIGSHYQVAKQLRDMIVFAHHSLIKDPPFSRLDLLVCRNFLIYLNEGMQQRLFTLFHQVLNPDGFLFLGSSESIGRDNTLFTPIDKKWKIFQRLGGAKRSVVLPPSHSTPVLAGLGRPFPPVRVEEPNPATAVEKVLMERFFPPGVVVNEKLEVVYFSNMTSRFLVQQTGEPTRDLMKMIREELRPPLRAAIHKAITEQQQVEFRRIKVTADSDRVLVNLRVEPVQVAPAHKLAMVVFETVAQEPPHPAGPPPGSEAIPGDEATKDALIRQLEEQLRINHEQLLTTLEQLENSNEGFMSVNEELISTNEELQSTNEELETSKEELQTLNEELVTVNAELREKVEELDQANGDLENLFTSSEIATIFLDRQLTIKRYSPAMAAICNIIPADLGRPFRHLAGTFDWPDLARYAREVMEKLTPVEREVAPLEGGRHYLKRVLPYRTIEGTVDGIVVTLVDITARRHMEVALRQAKEEWERTFDSIPDLIAIMDDQHRIVRVNRAMAERLGTTPDECQGRLCYRSVHGTEGPLGSCPHVLTMGDGREHATEVHEERLGGDFLVTTTPLLDEQGKMAGTVHVARDVTERNRAMESLRESEQRYRRLFDNMIEGFAYCRMIFEGGEARDFVYLAVNKAFTVLTGLQDVVGRRVSDVIPGIRQSDPGLFEIYGRVAQGGEPERFEMFVAAMGLWFDVTVYSPEKEHFVAVFDVINERKLAEEEREKTARLESLGVLAGGIAHDFNNILTAIIGNISLARWHTGEEHPATRQLDACESALAKATVLARQLLTFARGGEPVKEAVDTQQLLNEVVSFTLHGSNCRADLELSPELWRLDADAGQVHQALNNLIINALQAMPAGGTISVKANNEILEENNSLHIPAGHYVKITVADQGAGIPPEILGRIFDPYFTTKPAGTGLGLASAYSIVKRHGGAIDVTSVPGRGTIFTILLPAVEAGHQEEPVTAGHAEAIMASGQDRLILVMDDEEMILELAAAMLEKLGYRAVTCSDGAEAVSLYRQYRSSGHSFAAVILDMTVPGGMGGREAAERIIDIDPAAVLVISSGYSVDAAQNGEHPNLFRGAVAKPYNMRQLASELARLVKL